MAEIRNEAHVKKRITDLLDKHDWYWWKPAANAYGKSGIPDIHAITTGGVFLVIEAKFGYNKPSALQVGFLNSIRAMDGFAFVVNERNLDWLKAWLEAFSRSTLAMQRGAQPAPEDGAMMINAVAELTALIPTNDPVH